MEIAILSKSDYHKASGRRLRALIDALDLQYTEAAAIMGVSKHVLRNWMEGDNPIGPYHLYRLARAKGVDFDFVFLGDWSGLAKKVVDALGNPLESSRGALEAADQKESSKREARRQTAET